MDKLKVTPKDFFLWAAAMIALYWSIVAFITLLFSYIDYAYPDALSYYSDPYSGGMRFQIASLIVLFPLFLVLMRFIRNDIAMVPAKADLWIRRWALVLTVFIAGFSLAGDLIVLINYFLGGEVTVRFLLKVAIVLLVAGGAFMHFLADIWGYWVQYPQRARMVGWGAGLVIVLSIVAGFFIMGTPNQVRLYRLDEQKASDLQNIQWQIVNYWQQKGSLPSSLDELNDPLSGWQNPIDPETGAAYTYKRNSPLDFALCATFNVESRSTPAEAMPVRAYGPLDGNWQHGKGEVCFDRSIDPTRYPVNPGITKPINL